MLKYSANTYKGMRKDDSKFKQSAEYYYDAKNMKLVSLDNSSLSNLL